MHLQRTEIELVVDALKNSVEQLEPLKNLKQEFLNRSYSEHYPDVTRMNYQVTAQAIEQFFENVNKLHKRLRNTVGIYEKEDFKND